MAAHTEHRRGHGEAQPDQGVEEQGGLSEDHLAFQEGEVWGDLRYH